MLDLERPFHRLIHHFVFRIFHGAGEGDELQFSIPALMGIISVPAAFFSISLFGKYSTLMLYLMRRPAFDVYRASIPDEHFFIVFSMTVTGAIVISKWDRLKSRSHFEITIAPVTDFEVGPIVSRPPGLRQSCRAARIHSADLSSGARRSAFPCGVVRRGPQSGRLLYLSPRGHRCFQHI
jgi:hypothetical protein